MINRNTDLGRDGYSVIDDFLDKEDALNLYNLLSNTKDLYYKKSTENWPPSLYSFELPSGKVIESEDVLVAHEFIYTRDVGKEYLNEDNLQNTPSKKYPKDIFKIISNYQDNIFSYLESSLPKFSTDSIEKMITLPYKWPPNSNILWHDDGLWDIGLSLYLNPSWLKNCSGELLLEDGKWVFPAFNRCVMVMSKVEHRVNSIGPECPHRYSLQSFLKISYNANKTK